MKYKIIHKLAKQPVRDNRTLEIILFDSIEDAQVLLDIKNKQMQADFYKIVEVDALTLNETLSRAGII